MKYLVTLFWSFVVGQAVCYLGGALQSGTHDFKFSTIISLTIGVLTCILSFVMKPKHATSQA